MHITRRNFLEGAIAAGFTLAVVGNGNSVYGQKATRDFFPVPVEVYSQPLYSVTAKHFEALVGQIFSVSTAEGDVQNLILTQVKQNESLRNRVLGSYGESFSLVFENGSRDRSVLTQGVYQVSGNGMEFELLVVPIGPEKKQYQVVINHLSR